MLFKPYVQYIALGQYSNYMSHVTCGRDSIHSNRFPVQQPTIAIADFHVLCHTEAMSIRTQDPKAGPGALIISSFNVPSPDVARNIHKP